jgi:hypothetical protein
VFLQHPEQFDLDIQGNFADFVEKNRAAIRQFETTDAFGDGAGERAFFVAEQFTFNQAGRQRGAVDFN